MIRCPFCKRQDPDLTTQEVKLIASWLTQVRDNSRNAEETRSAAKTLLFALGAGTLPASAPQETPMDQRPADGEES